MAVERGHSHEQGHSHDHVGDDHAPIESAETGRYPLMAQAIRELLIEKGVITAEEVRKTLEFMDSRGPALGAKLVARAWLDPEFKKRLIATPNDACKELGIDALEAALIVVENTARIHNVVVCTLCSCYPRTVLGLPPDWYKSREYRSRVVIEPRAVLREFGTVIPDDVAVRVHDSNADLRYLVLPMRPKGTNGWSEAQLQAIVTRDCMVGVTTPRAS